LKTSLPSAAAIRNCSPDPVPVTVSLPGPALTKTAATPVP
jgi:hypothetical protein